MNLEGKIVNFLGDSITEGHGSSGPEKNYVSLVKEMLNLGAANNYGIGGTRIAPRQKLTENARHEQPFGTRVDAMDPNADVVVVFGGTNDFGHGDAPLGTFADTTDRTFYGAFKKLCVQLIEKYPGKPIVIITPLHRCSEDNVLGDGHYKMPLGTPLSAFVQAEREVAAYYSLPVLDLWATSGLQPCIPIIKEKFMPDGLHPNDAGYQILAEKIAAYLKTL